MANLSPSGAQLVQDLSQRYGVSTDAVTHMLQAVYNGNGSMAQFSHPEFGGSGQWMSGGMTMVSDLFNTNLKNLVNNLCSEISNSLANHQTTPFSGSFQSQSQNGSYGQSQAAGQIGSANSLFVPDPTGNWWPQDPEHQVQSGHRIILATLTSQTAIAWPSQQEASRGSMTRWTIRSVDLDSSKAAASRSRLPVSTEL